MRGGHLQEPARSTKGRPFITEPRQTEIGTAACPPFTRPLALARNAARPRGRGRFEPPGRYPQRRSPHRFGGRGYA
jgi:hypothetical protein